MGHAAFCLYMHGDVAGCKDGCRDGKAGLEEVRKMLPGVVIHSPLNLPVLTYLGKLRVQIDVVSHLLYLFVLGVPAYRIRWHVPVSLETTERVFRIFRQAIYGYLLYELQEIKLSGHIELDEALFGGRRKGGKRGWGAEGKTLVFGIYRRNGKVITFPVSDRRKETLIPLIRQHTRKGSLYYSDDHTAYASHTEYDWQASSHCS